MKELQKYYFEYVAGDFDGYEKPFYLASEADAAFAEMRREHAEEVERLKAEHQEGLAGFHRRLYSLQEETDSLNHDFKNFHRLLCDRFGYVHDERDWRRDQVSLIEHIASLRKQAERYEKLRRLNPQQFLELWKTNLMGPRFDDLVDQLPVSGEKP